MASDRIFGLVLLCVALAFIASAFQIQTSFLSDPVGSKTFPIIIGAIAAIAALTMILRPDPDPEWPATRTFGALVVAVSVMAAYAFLLKPMGFLLPTFVVTSILSYQIRPKAVPALLTGAGVAVGLFVLFKFILGLSLIGLPKAIFG
ncbi:MAG TPA: tripartite tricarboxylate transporter TctB family protein [Paracoccaceae bacterium]|nr:tripartite tricarboxylate transporter TctB family protein [Paracoccaceae bacterium]